MGLGPTPTRAGRRCVRLPIHLSRPGGVDTHRCFRARGLLGTTQELVRVLPRIDGRLSILPGSPLKADLYLGTQFGIFENFGANLFSLYDPSDAVPIIQIDANLGLPGAVLVSLLRGCRLLSAC
jgi:hypothetical protein